MLSCKELFDRLDAYLSGELNAEVIADVKRHIEACPNCLHYLNTYEKSVKLLGALPKAEMPLKLKEILLKIDPCK